MKPFRTKIEVRWADVDQNRHVRHSAYYDYGAHCRTRFFNSIGYDVNKISAHNIGPILFKEECSFIKEIQIDETLYVNMLKGAILPDGSRWTLHHEIFNDKDEKKAHLTVKGAWMDLSLRRLTIPPNELVEAFHSLTLGEAFTYKSKK